jgi:hypothetical protein
VRTIDKSLDLVKRREMLARKPKECPVCHETQQIQLLDWIQLPEWWRCRMCQSAFRAEHCEKAA